MNFKKIKYNYTGTNPYVSRHGRVAQTIIPTTTVNINSSFQINDDRNKPVVVVYQNGAVETPWGNTSIQETIEIIKLVKSLVVDLANDEVITKQHPILKEVAYNWLIGSLKNE